MKDLIRERLKNQGVELTKAIAKIMRERAGVKLSDEWTRKQVEPATPLYDKNDKHK